MADVIGEKELDEFSFCKVVSCSRCHADSQHSSRFSVTTGPAIPSVDKQIAGIKFFFVSLQIV